jgi:hypothetical protein
MEESPLRHFQYEILTQCEFAVTAYDDLQNAVKAHNDRRVWYSLQAFLVSCANISKIMWPQLPKDENRKARLKKRGEEVRKSLSVNDDSPLANRRFRNIFEHYDEAIEDWYTSANGRKFVDKWIGSREELDKKLTLGDAEILRQFDTTRNRLIFRGETFELDTVLPEIVKIGNGARRILDDPF